ncbi:type II secretion system F family protein [Patescibacteria group bacterium]|nr:type II secretion system F family protein [Patescibacteria group bacterium]
MAGKKEIKRKTSKAHTGIGHIGLTSKTLFTKHLSVMLKSGLTLNEALDIAADQSQSKMKKIVEDLRDQVIAGSSFADALKRHPKTFAKFFVSVIGVGERSGTLVKSLEELADQLEKDYQLKLKVIQAMLYPIIVLIAVVIVGTGISIFVLPKLKTLFEVFQGELPMSTKILLFIVDLFSKYGLIVIPAMVVGFFVLIFVLRSKPVRPFSHALLLKIPVVGGFSKDLNLARFNRNLGVLMRSGLPVTDALEIVAGVLSNEVYRRKTLKILAGVKAGKSINQVMGPMKHIFPKITSRMIGVGEKSGKLDEVLLYLAHFYEGEIDKASKNLSTVLEPILLIVIGLVVGFVMIAIMTPIYNLTNLVAGQ